MTSNIKQQVVPRHHRSNFSHNRLSGLAHRQSGKITNHAITLAFGLFTIIFCAALGFFYLQQVLGTASQGSEVHTLEAKIDELSEKQRQLELQGAELRSIRQVEQNVKEKLNLVDIDTVAYLVPVPGSVAFLEK